jgi:phosphohistidine phosphatase
MDLILIRHADASRDAPTDFDRDLTGKGEKQSTKVGRFLDYLGIKPDIILTSPLVRAKQTADLVDEVLKTKGGVVEDERLACGMDAKAAFAMLKDHKDKDSVAFVGHEPDFSNLCASLMGMESAYCIDVKKASCALFDVEERKVGGAALKWMVPPKLMGEL